MMNDIVALLTSSQSSAHWSFIITSGMVLYSITPMAAKIAFGSQTATMGFRVARFGNAFGQHKKQQVRKGQKEPKCHLPAHAPAALAGRHNDANHGQDNNGKGTGIPAVFFEQIRLNPIRTPALQNIDSLVQFRPGEGFVQVKVRAEIIWFQIQRRVDSGTGREGFLQAINSPNFIII